MSKGKPKGPRKGGLTVRDCSRFDPQPSAEQAAWLRRLAAAARVGELVVALSDERNDDDDLVYCDRSGDWWAGRYIGSIAFDGGTLTIEPRFGLDVIAEWLMESQNVLVTDTPGELKESRNFVVGLLAMAWGRAFAEAARHGLPALRREVKTEGTTIRGRLSVQDSVAMRAAGRPGVVSVRRERTLEHAVSDVLVAAYSVLRRELRGTALPWLPRRVAGLMPALIAASGPHPAVPSAGELARIRYTPITAGFARVAELSRQIAMRQGLSASATVEGEVHGVLMDVAELWELHVLHALRRGQPLAVRHGTRDAGARDKLLRSEVDGSGLGTLIPDALLYDGEQVRVIVDAKYKHIHRGPQREDLYQLSAYLGRFRPSGRAVAGMLVYPVDPAHPEQAAVEKNNPWRFGDDVHVWFAALPLDGASAVTHCGKLMDKVVAD